MRIDIEKAVPVDIEEKRLKKLVKEVLTREGRKNADLTVVFVDDTTIKDLNWRFRGKERPTDVLAFSLKTIQEEDPTGSLLGDVYISVPRAKAQAKDYGVTEENETARLVLHGVLHLLGYDHARRQEAKEMRKREEQHLGKYGGGKEMGEGGKRGKGRKVERSKKGEGRGKGSRGRESRGRGSAKPRA